MLKLLNAEEKSQILKKLKNLIQKFQQKGNKQMWWHSQRIFYSLKHELVSQKIFVDRFPDFSYIISRYTNKNAGKNIELFTLNENEIAMNEEASEAAVSMINNSSYSYAQIQSGPYYLYSYLNKSIKRNKLFIIEDIGANCMTYSKNRYNYLIKNIRPVDGYVCQNLTPKDAVLVNDRFKYARHPDTLKWISKTLTELPSMGCWSKAGDLVGQFIIMESGNVGGLYVIDECKGLKLGKWIAQEMTKHLLELDFPIVLETEFPNKVSYSLFTGMGYETYAQSYYMLFSRTPEVMDEI